MVTIFNIDKEKVKNFIDDIDFKQQMNMKKKAESWGFDPDEGEELPTNASTMRFTMIKELQGRPAIIKK